VRRTRGFRCQPESVAAARQFVREILRDHSSETVSATELMVSELATNCVRHAHTDFELTIDSQDQIRVAVRDMNQSRPIPRSPTPKEPSGRGLRIVEAMSDTWGIIPSSTGKTVWFKLNRTAPHETPAAVISYRRRAEATDHSDVPGKGGDSPAAEHARRTSNGSRGFIRCPPWVWGLHHRPAPMEARMSTDRRT